MISAGNLVMYIVLNLYYAGVCTAAIHNQFRVNVALAFVKYNKIHKVFNICTGS